MNYIKRTLAVLLIIAILAPTASALADTIPKNQGIQSVDNGYLKISVNPKNGGFHIATLEGDKLNKDDNNKDLLYPSGDYDTSFTSLRITRDGLVKDYIFGGKYRGSKLEDLIKDETGITAIWSVDEFTVIQRLELVAEKTSNHGMVQVAYDVKNNGTPAKVDLRILMDTALDKQDYAYYEVLRAGETGFDLVTKEEARKSKDYGNAFFAYNSLSAPTITAYSLKVGSDLYKDHEEVVFGHWNNLASTAFDYTPDPKMDFTNTQNTKYLTADSAYALYYDLGTVGKDGRAGAATIYGVYSHADIDPQEAKVTVDMSGPDRLTLDGEKKSYTDGSFTMAGLLNNFSSNTLNHIALAIRTPDGINPVVNGQVKTGYSHANPYIIKYENFLADQTRTAVINFQAEVRPESQYRKLIFDIYDISGIEAAGENLLSQNLIGTAEHYIYSPGGVMDLPEVSILSGSPDMIFHEGTRYFYLSGTGFSALHSQLDMGYYTMHLQRADGLETYPIDKDKLNINASENTASLLLNEKLPVGQYQLLFKAKSGSGLEDITSPALAFVVTDDVGQKNTTYGLIAVTKTGDRPDYNIEAFENETKYKEKYGSKPQELLLVFRGDFITEDDGPPMNNIIRAEGVSTSKDDNIMTLNNSIDIQEGKVVIWRDGDTIKVDFDAKLYTTGARSLIWSGTSGLTGLKNGEDFGLIPYDKNGKRLVGDDGKGIGDYEVGDKTKPINIIWGSLGGKGLQAVAGMLLKMEFGNLGVQIDTENKNKEIRKVVSFGARVDLGFLFPDPPKSGDDEKKSRDGSGMDNFISILGDLSTKVPDLADAPVDTLREAFASTVDPMGYGEDSDDDDDDDDDNEATLAIRVADVLFGGAYLGFNFSGDVKLPSYVEGFPVLKGSLKINTIGDWSMSAEGKVSFTSMVLEAKLGIKSYKGIPVPDNFYLYIGGFTPGINIDGFGVLWIMGGGGGLEGIYDTIFCSEGIPPLALLLSVQASIMQVFEARADLSLGLRGIGLHLTEGKVMKVKVIDSLRLKLDWYPEFYFLASINLDILEIIKGSGYIVVEHDGFFEFAARASLKIPEEVPVFGGMNVATIDLGANAVRIYGVAEVLFVKMGVVYYWGGDFEFGEKDELGAGPTYPDLLGIQGRPVYVDPDTGETLYMMVGTNLSPVAIQHIEASDKLVLLGNDHKLSSNTSLKEHQLTLDTYDGNHLLIVSYDASSKEDAEARKASMTFGDLDPIYYSNEENADNSQANAHFNYVEKDKKATIVISFTDSSKYNQAYDIKTPVQANLMLMKVGELPGLTSASYAESKVTVTGNDLDKLETMSFFAVNSGNKDDIYLLGKLKDDEISGSTTLTYDLTLPDTLPSGSYYIKVTGILEGYVADSVTTDTTFNHTNSQQPTNPDINKIEAIGDGMVQVKLTKPTPVDCDGYIVNVYKDNEPTDIRGLSFGQDDDIIIYGGKYDVPVFETRIEMDEEGNRTESLVLDENGNPIKKGTEKKGLDYGVSYSLGISAYKLDADGKIYMSGEVNEDFNFTEPTTTTINVSGTPYPTVLKIDYMGGKFDMPHYKAKDIELTLTAGDSVTGTWSLDKRDDEGYYEKIAAASKSINISLKDLAEGNHLLEFKGKNSNNDSVSLSYVFTVDTMAPRLLIESPDNGGFFDNGQDLEIRAITDEDATITVLRDKEELYKDKPELDGEGRFVIPLSDLPKNYASHKLTIIAEDALGNKTKADRSVVNRDLGRVQDWRLYANEDDITDKNIMKDGQGIQASHLSLRGHVATNPNLRSSQGAYGLIVNDPDIVSFNVAVQKGGAGIDDKDILTVEKDSVGVVSASMKISETHSILASAYFAFEENKEPIPSKPDPKPGPDSGGSSDAGPAGIKEPDPIPVPPTKPTPPSFDQDLPMPRGLSLPDYPVRDLATIEAGGGQKVVYDIGQDVDPNLVVVIYTTPEGEEILLPLTSVVDGKLNFKATLPGSYRIVESQVSFDDIQGHWGNADMVYVAARGLFKGTSDGIFSPSAKLTRAMMVTVLGRLANADIDGLTSSFDDVAEGTWYTAYVTWAKENGIVAGISDSSFAPDREITRQEFSTILYRYMNRIGVEIERKNLAFADNNNIAPWAREAMEACVGAGLLVGYDNQVRPGDHAMRSESATIFARLIRLLTKLEMD